MPRVLQLKYSPGRLETDAQLSSTRLNACAKGESEMTPSKLRPELPPAATPVSVAATDPSAAANDDSIPAVPNDLRNPLWIIAIGMGWFFGIVAAVMAAS
jgi:hypothetical protein